jgi:hypothetical protein
MSSLTHCSHQTGSGGEAWEHSNKEMLFLPTKQNISHVTFPFHILFSYSLSLSVPPRVWRTYSAPL